MRPWKASCISFLASSGLTLLAVCWPRAERPGWFELDGRPRTLDGVPVQDWQHANELLARHASAACEVLHAEHRAAAKGRTAPPQFHLRELLLEYEPAGRPDVVERVLLRQSTSARALWANRHPIAYATYGVAPAPDERK